MRKGFGNRPAPGNRATSPIRSSATAQARPQHQQSGSSFSGVGSTLTSIAGALALFGVGYFAAFHMTSSVLSNPHSEIDAKAPKSGIDRVAYYQDKAAEILRERLPKKMGRVTLVNATAHGGVLRYHYTANVSKKSIDVLKFRRIGKKHLLKRVCGSRAMRKVLKLGGSYEYRYNDKKGVRITTIKMSADKCDLS